MADTEANPLQEYKNEVNAAMAQVEGHIQDHDTQLAANRLVDELHLVKTPHQLRDRAEVIRGLCEDAIQYPLLKPMVDATLGKLDQCMSKSIPPLSETPTDTLNGLQDQFLVEFQAWPDGQRTRTFQVVRISKDALFDQKLFAEDYCRWSQNFDRVDVTLTQFRHQLLAHAPEHAPWLERLRYALKRLSAFMHRE